MPIPVPASASTIFGSPLRARGCENARSGLRKIALALPRFGITADQRRQLRLHRVRPASVTTRGGVRGGASSHSGSRAEQPALGLFGLFEVAQNDIRPRPAHPHQRLRTIPRPFAFGPCGVGEGGEKFLSGAYEKLGNLLIEKDPVAPAQAGAYLACRLPNRDRRDGLQPALERRGVICPKP